MVNCFKCLWVNTYALKYCYIDVCDFECFSEQGWLLTSQNISERFPNVNHHKSKHQTIKQSTFVILIITMCVYVRKKECEGHQSDG